MKCTCNPPAPKAARTMGRRLGVSARDIDRYYYRAEKFCAKHARTDKWACVMGTTRTIAEKKASTLAKKKTKTNTHRTSPTASERTQMRRGARKFANNPAILSINPPRKKKAKKKAKRKNSPLQIRPALSLTMFPNAGRYYAPSRGKPGKWGPGAYARRVTYYFLGPRSAHDNVEIGPFRTKAEAEKFLPTGTKKSIVKKRTVTGLEAQRIKDILSDQKKKNPCDTSQNPSPKKRKKRRQPAPKRKARKKTTKRVPRRNPAKTEPDAIAAHELWLYAVNTQPLYRQRLAIEANLERKLKRGTYDSAKAPKLWAYWMTEAAKRYTKEFDAPGAKYSVIFNKSTRDLAAEEMAKEWEDENLPSKPKPSKNPGRARTFKFANAPKEFLRRPDVKKAVAAYREFHGVDPDKISVMPVAGVEEGSVFWSMGIVPEATYTVPSKSKKAKGGPNYRHDYENPVAALVDPTGRTVVHAPLTKRTQIKEWMER